MTAPNTSGGIDFTKLLTLGGLGGLGGIGGLFGSSKPGKISLLDQQQTDLRDQLIQGLQGQGQFANLFSTDPQQTANLFNQAVAQPAITQFQEEVLPQITGQFRGAGLGNSTFAGQASARAGEGLERQLASALANTQFQQQNTAQNRMQEMLQRILGTPSFGYTQPQQSGVSNLFNSIAQFGALGLL